VTLRTVVATRYVTPLLTEPRTFAQEAEDVRGA
jgi:hypothetical protein